MASPSTRELPGALEWTIERDERSISRRPSRVGVMSDVSCPEITVMVSFAKSYRTS